MTDWDSNLLPWRSLIAVPRCTVNRDPPPISFLSLSGCCDSSRVATASRPSTTTDPLPFKRRTVDRGVAGAEVESGSIVSPVVEVGSPDTLGPATGSVVWVSGATSWPCSCMGKPADDFIEPAESDGPAGVGPDGAVPGDAEVANGRTGSLVNTTRAAVRGMTRRPT